MLRRKYRLTLAGREEEASALAQRIGKAIKRYNTTRLSIVDHKSGTKEMWAAVRELSGRRAKASHMEGATADSLNEHYASISTDPDYTEPRDPSIQST